MRVFLRWVAALSALLFVALAVLSNVALEPDGLLIFDSRMGGYTPEEARAYLAALAKVPGAGALYLGWFHTLDTLFPVLLALTLGALIWINRDGRWTSALLLAPLAYLAMDLAENALVADMLRNNGPLYDTLVMQASGFTVAKWVTLAIAGVIALWVWRAQAGRGHA